MPSSKLARVEIYDTTLRDGAQGEGVSISVNDMLKVAQKLDDLGVSFIEGGWPGSNPRDKEFFARAGSLKLKRAQLVAFGSTHHPSHQPEGDANLAALMEANTPWVAVVAKSCPRHVQGQLGISLKRNLEIVRGSVAWLTQQGLKVILDAEHFFDGCGHDPDYPLEVLKAAVSGGALSLGLCDTNGGSLPEFVGWHTARVRELFPSVGLGIHCHNDAGLAVANSLAAVAAGARQVQGTINGLGERCGNADLCSIIPALELKMGYRCLPPKRLAQLTHVSRFVQELLNLPPLRYQPYVGLSAFSHKGGLHISAVEKDPSLYEHTVPEAVGNQRRLMVSDLAGKAAILHKAKQFGITLKAGDAQAKEILTLLKERESLGYQYEGAEASFELLMNRVIGRERRWFDLVAFRVSDVKPSEEADPQAEATVQVRVGDEFAHTAALGQGPVHALDQALRKALTRFFPRLAEMGLVDYKVRVLSGADGTAAAVRVLITSSDGKDEWGTVGVSFDVLEASWQALGDSIRYKLLKDSRGK